MIWKLLIPIALTAYFVNFVNKTASVFGQNTQYLLVAFVLMSAIKIGIVENKGVKLSFLSLVGAFVKIFFIQQIFYAFFCVVGYLFVDAMPVKIDAAMRILSTYLGFFLINNFFEKMIYLGRLLHVGLLAVLEMMKSIFIMGYYQLDDKKRESFENSKIYYFIKKIYSKIKFMLVPSITKKVYTMKQIDTLGNNGRDFEQFVADFYSSKGLSALTTTDLKNDGNLPPAVMRMSGNGEQGVDVIVLFGKEMDIDGEKFTGLLIQCKHYSSTVGNSAIQEIYGAIPMYGRHFNQKFKPMCWTNNYFTPHATELAKSNGVGLIDRDSMMNLLDICVDDGLYGRKQKDNLKYKAA